MPLLPEQDMSPLSLSCAGRQLQQGVRTVLLGGLMLVLARPAIAADQWFAVDTNSWFTGWRSQLQELVDRDATLSTNELCVVGWQNGDPASLQAYLVWPAGHKLITWRPSKDDPHSLLHETNVTDLQKDVVATDRDVNGSTYRVTHAWVGHIESSCRKFGMTVRLSRRKAPANG